MQEHLSHVVRSGRVGWWETVSACLSSASVAGAVIPDFCSRAGTCFPSPLGPHSFTTWTLSSCRLLAPSSSSSGTTWTPARTRSAGARPALLPLLPVLGRPWLMLGQRPVAPAAVTAPRAPGRAEGRACPSSELVGRAACGGLGATRSSGLRNVELLLAQPCL